MVRKKMGDLSENVDHLKRQVDSLKSYMERERNSKLINLYSQFNINKVLDQTGIIGRCYSLKFDWEAVGKKTRRQKH